MSGSVEAIDKSAGREDKETMTASPVTRATFAAPAELGPTSVKAVLQDALSSSDDVLPSRTALRVIDIGCGSGALVRSLLRQERDAIGIDPDARMLQAALSGARPAPPGRWIAGTAERLPIADRSVDVAIFLNSLHHIAMDRQVAALAEAARVLRAGGEVLVIEPVAAGSFFELLAPLDDETRVRAAAQAALHAVAVRQLLPVAAARFTTTVTFPDPESVVRSFTAADPTRARLAEAVAPQIAERFLRLGRIAADGASCFDQPMTLHRLRKN